MPSAAAPDSKMFLCTFLSLQTSERFTRIGAKLTIETQLFGLSEAWRAAWTGGANLKRGPFGLGGKWAGAPDCKNDRQGEGRRGNRLVAAGGGEREHANLAVMLVWTVAIFGRVGGDQDLGRKQGEDSGDQRCARMFPEKL